jgi:hypothetical protein
MANQPARTYPWGERFTLGSWLIRISTPALRVYTKGKKVATASTTAVLAATNGATSIVTVTSGITDPDVPRNLTVTGGGTTAQILDS